MGGTMITGIMYFSGVNEAHNELKEIRQWELRAALRKAARLARLAEQTAQRRRVDSQRTQKRLDTLAEPEIIELKPKVEQSSSPRCGHDWADELSLERRE